MEYFSQLQGWGTEALALVLGAVFVVHAIPKIRRPAGMAQSMGWPKAAVVVLGLAELAGGLAVITGIHDEWAGLALAAVMLGALYHKIFKWKVPFTSSSTTGWEFDVVLLASALAIALG